MFIVLDGVEGTGKSRQAKELVKVLQTSGLDVVLTREPGSSSIGPELRSVLLRPGLTIDPKAEALLMMAERTQHVREVILPVLERNAIVVCDRFSPSTYAYQGFARGLGFDWIREINEWASAGLVPDLTVLFDLDPVIGLSRKTGDEIQRMEEEDLSFHNAVRAAYRQLPELLPNTVLIDAGGEYEEVQTRFYQLLGEQFPVLKSHLSK